MTLTQVAWQTLSMQLVITLVHFLWQATLIGVALALAQRLLPAKRSNTRYLMACMAFALLPGCASATFVWVNRGGESIVAAKQFDDARVTAQLPIPQSVRPTEVVTVIEMPTELQQPLPRGATSETTSMTAVSATPHVDWTTALHACSPYVFGVYLIGVIAMLARFLISISGGTAYCWCRILVPSISATAMSVCFPIMMKKLHTTS